MQFKIAQHLALCVTIATIGQKKKKCSTKAPHRSSSGPEGKILGEPLIYNNYLHRRHQSPANQEFCFQKQSNSSSTKQNVKMICHSSFFLSASGIPRYTSSVHLSSVLAIMANSCSPSNQPEKEQFQGTFFPFPARKNIQDSRTKENPIMAPSISQRTKGCRDV